jgi:two-component system, LytTR family, response regulator
MMSRARVTALVADDEPIARAGLRRMLSAFDWVEVIAEAVHGPDAVDAINAHLPDLVFLDIQMPGLLGTEVAARITHQPCVVFTTAHARHAVTAFELGAVDYLLKPFGAERLSATMERVRAALGEPAMDGSLDRISEVFGAGPLRRLFVRTGGAIAPVPVSSIAWFEADGDYVTAHTERGRHVLTVSLNQLESRLDKKRFVRIHRTHIVNLDAVVAFRRHGKGGMSAELRGGLHLAVSRARAQELRKLGV